MSNPNHCGSAGLGLRIDDIFDGDSEALIAAQGNATGRAGRVNAGHEQGFCSIDVPYTDYYLAIHDEILDGYLPGARAAVQVAGHEVAK